MIPFNSIHNSFKDAINASVLGQITSQVEGMSGRAQNQEDSLGHFSKDEIRGKLNRKSLVF